MLSYAGCPIRSVSKTGDSNFLLRHGCYRSGFGVLLDDIPVRRTPQNQECHSHILPGSIGSQANYRIMAPESGPHQLPGVELEQRQFQAAAEI
jgi:hypothetical protein